MQIRVNLVPGDYERADLGTSRNSFTDSKTVTEWPASEIAMAAESPPIPAPTTRVLSLAADVGWETASDISCMGNL